MSSLAQSNAVVSVVALHEAGDPAGVGHDVALKGGSFSELGQSPGGFGRDWSGEGWMLMLADQGEEVLTAGQGTTE